MSTTPRPPTLAALQRRLEERDAEIIVLKLLVEKLELQLLKSRRSRFGQSSEQLDGRPTLAVAPPVPAPTERVPTPANRPAIDRSLPAHLPREPHVHRPAVTDAAHDAMGRTCGCKSCGGRLRQIGQDVSEQLEYIPARFKVVRHVRPKLGCVACQTIFQANAPSRPIMRDVAGPALLAHVMVSKFYDHIPLHRLARIHARDGVCVDPSTYGGWLEQCLALVDPLVAALGRYTLAGAKVHADDTPVPVLDPGRGKTKTGRLWVYVRDDRPAGSTEPPAAWYQYTPNRKGEHPQQHLQDYVTHSTEFNAHGHGRVPTCASVRSYPKIGNVRENSKNGRGLPRPTA